RPVGETAQKRHTRPRHGPASERHDTASAPSATAPHLHAGVADLGLEGIFVMSGIARELSGAVVKLKAAAGFRTPVEEKAPVAANEDVAPARAEPTVISASSHLAGSISTADEVYVQGKVEGDVRAASVVVYEGGVVRGDIS